MASAENDDEESNNEPDIIGKFFKYLEYTQLTKMLIQLNSRSLNTNGHDRAS